jgi:hypothetical protein
MRCPRKRCCSTGKKVLSGFETEDGSIEQFALSCVLNENNVTQKSVEWGILHREKENMTIPSMCPEVSHNGAHWEGHEAKRVRMLPLSLRQEHRKYSP